MRSVKEGDVARLGSLDGALVRHAVSLWRYYKQLARPDRPLALFVQGHVLCTCAMASAIGFPSLPESRLAQWIRWNKVVY
jgi:hypothetical protein